MSDVKTGMDSNGTRGYSTGIDDALRRASAVSWGAILAGAAGAAALSMLLLFLGTGLGFSVVSPWATQGVSVATFGFAAIAWVSFTQLAASGMGGYLAGRLRTKWVAVHTDEVYFRDTAHGFLAWAVASLLTALLVTTVVGSIISGGARSGAAVAGGVAESAVTMTAAGTDSDQAGDTIEYFVDSLFRSDSEGSASGTQMQMNQFDSQYREMPTGEVARIFTQAMSSGSLSQEDERYIGQLIAQHTDLRPEAAEQRASEIFENMQGTLDEAETQLRQVADEAREASVYAALWMFIALLMGAFVASLMAVFGGRQRDA